MTVQVLYKKASNLAIFKNLVFFTNEKFQIDHLKKELSLRNFSLIKDFLKNKDYLKKKIINFNLNSNQTVILVSLKNKLRSNEIEKIGANFFDFIKNHSFFETSIFYESIKINQLREESLDEFLHGLQLKSYDFNVYKSKKNTNSFKINIISKKMKNFK